ncbi:hypothetical protein HELRODRAFT_116629 [Helobdella robusta]|uniref:protein-tyrosine-phosphatase n=1 Tax=Helobdella robusta TaxID=6412 RepID=T1EGG7_HELRO|nr:hypothetical protein HELRODRAFT_116629 [Helobdella robusta]ESN89995.1 hypothetical protein HELRODRAFT_116629 [Helobdella robusta]
MKELHAPPVAEGHAADADDCDDDDDDPQYSDDVQLNKILLSDPSELKVTSSSKLHPPIPVSELWNFVVPRKQYADDKIRKEFNELKQNVIYKATASCRAENRSKNRYCNVLAYDHSRVVLRCSPHQSDYINANYIDGFNKPKAYVACQGPTRSTVNDFWRMVWQLNARIILMVTNLVENGRHKCDIYWPDAGSSKYGDIVVQLKHLEGYADYKIRTFAVASSSNGAETREVIQLHFTTWPDNGVPLHPTALLELRKRITNKNDANFTEHPIVVHCSAGVGRTGTYIALDSLLEQAEQEKRVDVFGCVNNMRNQRVNMVQTVEQYIFIYDALLEALEKSSTTVISCSEFRRRYAELMTVDPATNMSYLHREFVSLQSKNVLYSHDDDDDFDDDNFDGDDDNNEKIATKKQKNVGAKIALKKKKKPKKIKKAVREEPRAVLVDGYRQKAAFLVMQTPLTLPSIDYFWSIILQHKCGAIISFDDEDGAEDFIPYCPKVERSKCNSEGYEAAETFTAGSFSIQTISSSSSSVAPSPGSCADHPLCFNEQEFILSFKPSATNNQNNEIIIKRFSMNNWRRKSKTTSSDNKNAKPPTATSSAKNLTNNSNKINHNTKRSDNDDNAHHVGDDNDTQKRDDDDDDNGICDDDGHDDDLPRRFTILTLLSSLEKWQQKTGNNTVLVHCRNGTRYSGLFCTASYLIERLKIEHEVDMYMAVRYIRVNRHQFVPSLVQYDYLYKLIIDYLDSFDTYANFESSI